MANSDARGARRVKCPRCNSVLEEPNAPVYQCGGCRTSLRAKNRSGDKQDVASASASPSRSGLPPQSRHFGSSDVASTSRSSTRTPDATSSRHQATNTRSRRDSSDLVLARNHGSGDVANTSSAPDATNSRRQATDTRSRGESGDLAARRKHDSGDVASSSSTPDATSSRRLTTDTTSRRESGDFVLERNRVSDQVPLIEKRGHDQSANRGVHDNSEARRQRDTGDAELSVTSPGVSAPFPRGSKDTSSELQDDTVKRRKGQAEFPDAAARQKHSGEAAAQPRPLDREELAPKSAQAAAAQPARDVSRQEDDAAAAAAGGKAPSPSRHELQPENLAPLRQKILKMVDELKGDLSELFSKSPEVISTTRARPPRLPKQDGYVSRAAMSPRLPARARHAAAAAVDHRGSAVRVGKPVAPPPRGLPSRRYRRCRADPCCDNVQPRSCHHRCCRHHGKPECSSCRGHCCRPRAQEPSAPRNKPPAAKEAKRRLPPRHHWRPVLKGAPFIICSGCFKLVQVPADFAISTKTVRKLRCGSCSAVLSYSYRDPARKKRYEESIDQFSTDGSEVHGGKGYAQDPFAPFVDGFGLSSYSTDEEQPLHISRNTSFDTVDAMNGVGRLHQLMGYGSASKLLRHSPDLYESFDERTTPEYAAHYDRKGKGVCVDADDDDFDDSDDEDSGVLKRSAARGAGWSLPGMLGQLGKGVHGPGAIRIKS